MPWRNGGGFTTEVAREPREGEFDWRVSIARVEHDGPFSLFAGFDRVILALDGAGMVLTHEEPGSSVTLGVLEPWTFRGEWTTQCALRGGPIRDFNVIARRGLFTPSVSVLHIDEPAMIDLAAPTVLLYCADGSALVGGHEISRDMTLWFGCDEHDSAIRIRPLAKHVTLANVAISPERRIG